MTELKDLVLDTANSLKEEFSSEELLHQGTFFNTFFDSMNQYIEYSTQALSVFNHINADITKSFTELKTLNFLQSNAIDDKYKQNISAIDKETFANINSLKKRINEYENNTMNLIEHNKEEKLLITSTTNPYIYKYLIDKNSNLELLDIDKNAAKKRYDEIVDNITRQRDKLNLQIQSSNNKFMHGYNEASKNVIKSMNDKLESINKQISDIDAALNQLKGEFDMQSLEIEKSFNRDVIANKKSVEAEKSALLEKYNQDKKDTSNIKADQDEKKVIQRSQVMKEFAQSISTLNDKVEILEANQKMHLRENTSIFELNIFELNAKIRAIKEKALESGQKLNSIKTLEELHKLNSMKKKENKALKLKLKTIKSGYKTKFDEIEKDKYLCEHIKNNQIEKINHMVSIDENAYHHKLNLLQRNYDFDIEQIERKSEKDIKEFRSKYDQIKLDRAKEYKLKQTKLFEQRQVLLHDADVINDEMELAYKLEDQVILNNDSRLNNTISKNSINALLEIEKNNLLHRYNTLKIKTLIENESIKYLYNEQCEFNERDRKKAIVDVNLEKALIDIEHNKVIFGLEIQKAIFNEGYKKNIENVIYNEQSANIKASTAYAQFLNRKKYLLALYDTASKILLSNIKLMYEISRKVYLARYTNAQNLIKNYAKGLQFVILRIDMSLKNILTKIRECVINTIKDQITFETGDKYKSLFNGLDAKYESDRRQLDEREENLNETIQNYNSAIKRFYSSISSLDINIKSYETKLKGDNITDKSLLNREITELKNERKRLQHLIDKNENQIDKFKYQLDRIPHIKEQILNDLTKKKNKLINKQQDEAKVLYDSIEKFNDFFDTINSYIDKTSNSVTNIDDDNDVYLKKFFKFMSDTLSNSSKTISRFLSIIMDLDSNVSKKYNNLLKQNNKSFYEQELIFDRSYNREISHISELIKAEDEKYADKLKANKQKLDNVLSKYQKLRDDNKNQYDLVKEKLDNNLKQEYEEFYRSTTAIKQSLLDNINKANATDKKLLDENDTNNKNLVKTYMDRRNDLGMQNKEKIKNFQENLNLIPIEHKNQIKSIQNELNLYNKDYLLESKRMQIELTHELKEKNREAIKYSNDIHAKIFKCNSILTKSRKALSVIK